MTIGFQNRAVDVQSTSASHDRGEEGVACGGCAWSDRPAAYVSVPRLPTGVADLTPRFVAGSGREAETNAGRQAISGRIRVHFKSVDKSAILSG